MEKSPVKAVGTQQNCRQKNTCLLYTSDAADEEDSVGLGGLRILKKKKQKKMKWPGEKTQQK